MRNVACTGAIPIALTDCLNYNNPEDPELLWEFEQGVKGIADTCKGIELKEYPGNPTPIISGNVSLYNSIDGTAIIGCAGRIADYRKAITPQLKQAGNKLFLLGDRRNELGASEFYHLLGHLGANVPTVDFKQAQGEIYSVIDGIDQGVIVSAHDISEGGLLVALAEMTMPHQRNGGGKLGVKADLSGCGEGLKSYQKAFSETGGFILEIPAEKLDDFKGICEQNQVEPLYLGEVVSDPSFQITDGDTPLVSQSLAVLQDAWLNSLSKYLK
jgi:phosphoribosylformylglycinamidine (FGAM) synthase-like enzyme